MSMDPTRYSKINQQKPPTSEQVKKELVDLANYKINTFTHTRPEKIVIHKTSSDKKR